jgi:hypothetical protein
VYYSEIKQQVIVMNDLTRFGQGMQLRRQPTATTKEQRLLKMQNEFEGGLQEIIANANQSFSLRDLRESTTNSLTGGYDFADPLHNIYSDFGYPFTLTFFNFWNMYRRFGIARAVCNIPPDFTWSDLPEIDGGDKFNSELEQLALNIKLWARLKGLDRRQRVGRYAGLFVRVKDDKELTEPIDSLTGIDSVESVTPLYEGQLKISTTDDDPKSVNFGNPVLYNVETSATGGRNERSSASFTVHFSRVITVAEDSDDGSIYGISALESVFNDLMDLRKISGAGGEGFYQNTRSAPVITTKEGYKLPSTQKDKDALEEQMDEYLNKWRKKFVSAGFEFQYPDIKLDNPAEFYQNSLSNVSGGSGIVTKILIGHQEGRLASDEDAKHFLGTQNIRRSDFGTEIIVKWIDWCVLFNVLPAPVDLTIEWSDLLARSQDEQIETSGKMAKTNEAQFRAGGSPVFSEEEIREIAGFDPEELPEDNEDEPDDDEDLDDAGRNE